MNETNYYPLGAYRGGGWPPGHDDRDEWALVDEAIHLATAEAAVRLRADRRAGRVDLRARRRSSRRTTIAETARVRSSASTRSTGRPGLGLFRDGVLRVPGREPVERPDLAGAFDLIGFSYYSAMGVRDGPHRRRIRPTRRSRRSATASGPTASALVLDRLHAELPGTPLLVAEYGIGTDDDAVRAAYLERGLAIVHDAIARGVDVRGFFHWTGVDNYEWLHGYDVAFGIIDRDRKVRPSAEVLRREARGAG